MSDVTTIHSGERCGRCETLVLEPNTVADSALDPVCGLPSDVLRWIRLVAVVPQPPRVPR